MPAELILRFPSPHQVSVTYQGTDSGLCDFKSPITDQDRKEITWYVETYGVHSLAEPDDAEARRIEARLAEIGKALFNAVFSERAAARLFNRFQEEEHHRVLTIDSEHAAILSLPWELLHDPDGLFLFRENPRISVRRRISGATRGRAAFPLQAKERLHLLFVVSRPLDAGFIDPRADPRAVLDALAQHAPGRVTWEFLRPATLNALEERLRDDTRAAIDILHFDGHGTFQQVTREEAERDPGRFGRAIQSEILRERQLRGETREEAAVGIGFLLFEREDGRGHLISAEDLRENLHRARVGLVVLSACQSAALDPAGDPMASVAGRLTATGIPATLAMTHSVLVVTTRALFSRFYGALARGRGIATALDDARAWLANNPEKFEVYRDGQRKMLELDDWFLPALFHAGEDTPLLTTGAAAEAPPGREEPIHNLRPAHEAGFFGRRRELWQIERWLAGGRTRRISITGFGGQGKTELALEAGRWLLRTGLFARAVFVDYAQVQAEDAVGVAVSLIGQVLGQSLPDAEAAGRALADAPTLIILDNLESLAPAPLAELLGAAQKWSETGPTRVLLTSRRPDFQHPGYRIEGTHLHRRIALEGLGSREYPDDAIDWFIALNALPAADEAGRIPPPSREALIELFDKVAFHPLSIAVLAQQLRTRSARQLGERLEQLLDPAARSPLHQEGTPPSLIASLQLSLDRLDPAQRKLVGRLGVFQGGAFEDDLLAITGLGTDEGEREYVQGVLAALEGDDLREMLRVMGMALPEGAAVPEELAAQLRKDKQELIRQVRDQLASLPAPQADNVWPALRRQLEAAALIEAESIPSVTPPFLRFHPTLAPMLWAGLDAQEQARLTLAHRRRYYALAGYLYQADDTNPHEARAIARRELPNLRHAVDQALMAGDADAMAFIDWVNRFLKVVGMTREAAALTRRAEQVAGSPGSQAWYLAQFNRGEQLLAGGQVAEAVECFEAIRKSLGETPSYELAVTLGRLGRCYKAGGRPDLAEGHYQRGIAVTEALEPSREVQRQRGALHTALGDVLRVQGRFNEAREQYLKGREVDKELKDLRGQGVTEGQLGTLALEKGDLAEAARRHQEALALFQRLKEPASEAVAHHQLGIVFQKARQWEQAERHYRESATLNERHGKLAVAAGTWNQLAMVCEFTGRPDAAETWYRKAIDGGKATGDTANVAKMLSNLADLLQHQPDRLAEARRLAEEALAIKLTLEPGAAEIWQICTILAQIAERQARPDQAADYRRQAREAKRRFAGTAHELKRFAPLIAAVVSAVGGHEEARAGCEGWITQLNQAGGENAKLAQAIQRILSGERDAEILCGQVGLTTAMIVETILQALEDPTTLERLLSRDEEEE